MLFRLPIADYRLSMYGSDVKHTPALVLTLLTLACSPAPRAPANVADFPDIDTTVALRDITRLSSDEFEGRLPGTKGEQLTVQYLTDQFKAIGLEPGNPDGTYV